MNSTSAIGHEAWRGTSLSGSASKGMVVDNAAGAAIASVFAMAASSTWRAYYGIAFDHTGRLSDIADAVVGDRWRRMAQRLSNRPSIESMENEVGGACRPGRNAVITGDGTVYLCPDFFSGRHDQGDANFALDTRDLILVHEFSHLEGAQDVYDQVCADIVRVGDSSGPRVSDPLARKYRGSQDAAMLAETHPEQAVWSAENYAFAVSLARWFLP